MAKKRKSHSRLRTFLFHFWPHVLFIFFMVNFVITQAIKLTFYAQSCMTKEMVAQDARCLYIYGQQIY
jgi:hypothetical protein